jgi:hypothetical protein
MFSSVYYGYWDQWEFQHKVVFDGPNKLIHVAFGVTTIDVRRDLYSAWKEWIQKNPDGLISARFFYATRSVGGDPLPGGRQLGSTFFLSNGWRIKPYQGSYRLVITGNLYTDEGESPFVDADGLLNNIRIESTVSTLVEAVGVGTRSEVAEAVWGIDPANYENEDDTMGQTIINTGNKVNLIPGLF